MVQTQFRNWCFTSFLKEAPFYDKDNMCYLLYGKEICPTTKRKHWQGFVVFKREVSMNIAQQLTKCPNVSFRACKGSPQQNIVYCTKDKKFKEFGERPKQGKRSDLDEIARLAPTTSVRNLVRTFGGNALRHIRMIREYQRALYEPDWIEQHLQDTEDARNMSRDDLERMLLERHT